jgi:hypothetical protein
MQLLVQYLTRSHFSYNANTDTDTDTESSKRPLMKTRRTSNACHTDTSQPLTRLQRTLELSPGMYKPGPVADEVQND